MKVRCCGVCRTDLHVVEGELPPQRMPVIPGHQIVGTVDSLGPDCARLHLGQRIGAAWLRWTCGRCRFCATQRENLCDPLAEANRALQDFKADRIRGTGVLVT